MIVGSLMPQVLSKLEATKPNLMLTVTTPMTQAAVRLVRDLVQHGEFVEVFVSTPLEVCEQRDTKGLYAKARRGELPHFTGIDSPYEPPESAELRLDTTAQGAEALAEQVVKRLLGD